MPEWINPLKQRTTTLDLGLKGKLVKQFANADSWPGITPIYDSVVAMFREESAQDE